MYSERNASARENHPTREKATRDGEREKCVSPFQAWGDFQARSCFARSTIPEEKWGTIRSLIMPMLFSRKSDQLRNSSHKACFQVSNSAGLLQKRCVLLDIVVRYFGFLITLRKLKTSKVNLKFKMHAQICHCLIPFCLPQKKKLYALLQIVNGMLWKLHFLALVGCGRLVKTNVFTTSLK